MNDKRFIWKCDDENCCIYDIEEEKAYFNVEVVDKLNEQQFIIEDLQDLCGESDYENARLRLENKKLQDKIDWLCEKYDYPINKGCEK